MTNWKAKETIVYIILGVAVLSLLFPQGFVVIPELAKKIGPFEWKTILAVSLGFTIYLFRQMVRV